MATSALATPTSALTPCMDRHDAARALLGCLSAHTISPQLSNTSTISTVVTERVVSSEDDGEGSTSTYASGTSTPSSLISPMDIVSTSSDQLNQDTSNTTDTIPSDTNEEPEYSAINNGGWADALLKLKESRPKNYGGLDALAVLASSAASIQETDVNNAMEEDTEAIEQIPLRRMRSVSNPEGMEKWDSLKRGKHLMRHFVQSSILEEESLPSSATSDGEPMDLDMSEVPSSSNMLSIEKRGMSGSSPEESDVAQQEVSSEKDLDPAELLRRARMRLLEDVNDNGTGEKGDLTLPHTLTKYREIYNKNGRIGIYTPAERAAIIAKFQLKRSRRVWNKKIRYNCRKNLADRRMRVKGRFVKRSSEEAAVTLAAVAMSETPSSPDERTGISSSPQGSALSTPASRSSPPPGALPTVSEMDTLPDAQASALPKVGDKETSLQQDEEPFQKTRRHSIA